MSGKPKYQTREREHNHILKAGYVTVLLVLASCASPGPRERVSSLRDSEQIRTESQKIEPEARTQFFQAERAFLAREYDKALRVYHAVRTRFPAAQRAQILSSYRIGTIYYYQENYTSAAQEFGGFLQRWPQSELAFDVRYNLAAAEYQLGQYDRAYRTLSTFRLSEVRAQGTRRAEVVFQLTALAAEALGNHPGAVAAYAAHAQLPLSETKRSEILARAQAHITQIRHTADLDRLLSKVSEPAIRQLITQRMSVLAQGGGVGAPEADSGGEAPSLRSGTRGDRQNIGVILPLTGKMARYGRRALEGIVLAANVFSERRNEDFRIFIEDSESNPEVARRAVDVLVEKHDVMAVLGPMSWRESLAVADRAQQLGVPNLSLAGKEGLSARGAYLFQNALTPRVQLENLVQFVTGEKGFRRFAILAPNNSYGLDMANQFWDLVERSGGSIVAYRTYKPNEADFQNEIRIMTGLADIPKFRSLEAMALEKFQEEYKTKTGRKTRAQIPPIVDFDAIFLPDSPKTVAQIAASLTYFDVTQAALLGTTEWNTSELYKLGGRHVEGAIFPGGLNLNTRDETQKDFITRFRSAYGDVPDLLAVQSFEAMRIVARAIDEASSSNRNDVVRELARMEGFASPLGSVSFDATRTARRRLPIFTLEYGGNIVSQ